MTLNELLIELFQRDVKLSIDDSENSRLRIQAPKGAITSELQLLLGEHKAEILSFIRDSQQTLETSDLPKIDPCPQDRNRPFPLTDLQHAFWIGRNGALELGDVANHGYYEIEGENLKLDRLSEALQKLIVRHDMLRAIVQSDGQQKVLEQVPPYEIKVLNLTESTAIIAEEQIEAIRRRLSHQVMPTNRWPLFEFCITLLKHNKYRLHISYDLQIFDAWSLFRFFDEWFQLYKNPQFTLKPLSISFRDYVLAERKLEQTKLYRRSQEYWLARLDSLPTAPDLPLARNPKELNQPSCQRYEAKLTKTDWQQLKQKAAQIGLTPSGILLAAFTEILTAWSKSPQFTINLALFNRLPLHAQVNDILGDFTSVTLLAVDNSRAESFRERAIRLQKQLWQDLEHRYFSGVRVIRELARKQGTTPNAIPIVFTSTLGMNTSGQEVSTFSHFGELVYGISQASQVWLDFQVWQSQEALSFNWDVVEELFPEGLIQDMFEAYCHLLQQLASPQADWQTVNRQLTPPDRLAKRQTFNDTKVSIADGMLHTLFAARVKDANNNCAVISSQRNLSYQELSDLANQVAHKLRSLGITANELVAVVMEKGWEQIVAVLGILTAGAAYVPIDPNLPLERQEYILKNSRVKVVLTQSWLKQQISGLVEGVVQICIDNHELAHENKELLEPVQTSDDLAYLIYTSGSTGVPKGVMINHRGAVNTILDINQRFQVSSRDRILALSSLSFDLSAYDIFGTLAAGGTIVIPDANLAKEPAHWFQLMMQHQVSIWNSAPALMEMLVNGTSDRLESLSQSLRLVMLSGDWLPLSLAPRMRNICPNVQLISLGGAGETNKNKTIKAGAVLENIELFDASFFGFNPKEAETMDPQHRLFLECAWEVLENAGYDSETEDRPIGVYAGVGMGTYLLHNLSPNRDLMKSQGFLPTLIGVDKDYLPTRVSYKLNLKGPSISVGTACSSSLVAVHLAWQSLLNGECDMALAAGVSVKVPQNELTLSPGEIASPDGHCRAFSAEANGTIGGNGIGVVLLKRLEDAIADRDRIYAVIKGSAINNDGGAKVGYTAPSEEGQAKVIRAAQVLSEVEPETISYVEAHGTGTSLGDPIEVAALTKAFRASTNKKGYCTLGSVKTNVGHLDAAAGITGLIKTILSLDRQSIPPSLNFKQPNPHIDFENSPFYVNTKLSEWKANGVPRRAGVSSFGVGGTNAHVILEEAPPVSAAPPKRSQELLLLSAKTPAALETVTVNLANYLKCHPKISLADVAYTLQVGRKAFDYRRIVVAESIESAVNALDSVVSQQVSTQLPESEAPPVVFMFTGQGAQYVNMVQELYQNETIFRQECDRCCELLQPHLGFDLRSYLYPPEVEFSVAAERLKQTSITQPALFVIEYSLAKLWMSWGVNPVATIGHSIGEYVAATLANVFELEDALSLIVARGRMMQQLPEGSMLSVGLSVEELKPLLNSELSLAVSNAPKLSVVSGSNEAIALFKEELQDRDIDCRSLHTSHAFHSPMMDAIVEPFTQRVAQVKLKQPQIPFISNLTGTWISAAEATNPNYWGQHLRQGVQFAAGIKELQSDSRRIFLEIGPGRTLTTLAKQQAPQRVVISCLPHPKDKQSDSSLMLNALGKLWLNGVKVDWKEFSNHQQRHRVPLPTYPFERQRYWIDPPSVLETQNGNGRQAVSKPQKKANSSDKRNLADWLYIPKWQQSGSKTVKDDALLACTLVFVSSSGWGKQLIKQLQQQGKEAISVEIGSEFARLKDFAYSINPQQPHDYQTLLAELARQNRTPTTIVHFWNVTSDNEDNLELKHIDRTQYRGFYSLMFLAQAIGSQNLTQQMQIIAAANQLQAVKTKDTLHPAKATLMGAVKVIPLEYPNITCRSIDLDVADPDGDRSEELWQELVADSDEQIIAYRDRQRWIQTFEPAKLEDSQTSAPKLREGGVYLITGGLGGIGLVLAKYLAKIRAKLLLTGRSTIPDRANWTQWLTTHARHDRTSRKILKLQELERLGAEIIVATADVNNLKQMELAIARAQKAWGNLNGIIHAAGVPGGGVIQRKSLQNIDAVLAPKVRGTVVLDSLTKNTQLDFLVLCSSLASVLGGFGQADYVAANAFLDSFAHYRNARDRGLTVAINWDVWKEVGMAAETAETQLNKPKTRPLNHPLFNSYVDNSSGTTYLSQLSVSQDWILKEHRIMGKAMIPGTGLLAMILAAGQEHPASKKHHQIELREVYFPTPLIVEDHEEKVVQTILQAKGDGYEFKIVSPSPSDSHQWLEHAIGEIAWSETKSSSTIDLLELKSKCDRQKINISYPEYQPLAGFAEFGLRWSNLQKINMGNNAGLALLELPELFSRDLLEYQLHPALLDIAVHFLSGQLKNEGYYLPFSYKKISVQDSLPRKIYSYAKLVANDSSKRTLKFDIQLFDIRGKELAKIEEYTMRKFNENK